MGTLVTQAFQLATEIHAGQIRKASIVPRIPYISHLMEVAGIVMSSGAAEPVVAAALLHDAIEDQGVQTREPIREQLGPDVLAIVEECTEPGVGSAVKAPWRERKEGYLQHIQQVSLAALMIIIADKLHNLRDLRKQVTIYGEEAYTSFNAGKDAKLWFYQAVVQAAEQRLSVLATEPEMEQQVVISLRYLLQEQREHLAYLQMD